MLAMRANAFKGMRDEFIALRGISCEQLQRSLIAKEQPLTEEWHQALSALPQWCIDCKREHMPTATCVPCTFDAGFLHAPMPKDIYFDYRGWRWTPPFICMGCGIEVCYRQWQFSRSCGACDVSESRTRKLLSGRCFAGPHDKLSSWSAVKHDIPEDHFVDPKDRMKWKARAEQSGWRD